MCWRASDHNVGFLFNILISKSFYRPHRFGARLAIPSSMPRTWETLLQRAVTALIRTAYRLRVDKPVPLPSGGALVIANHITFIDGLVATAATGRPMRFVMADKYTDLPVARALVRSGHLIPIASAKRDPARLQAALEQIAEALDRGETVCIFPEGRLTPNGQLGDFRQGIEWILARTPVPVVPMVLQGLWGSRFSLAPKGKRGRLLSRRRVDVRFGRVLPPNLSAAEYEAKIAALDGRPRRITVRGAVAPGFARRAA